MMKTRRHVSREIENNDEFSRKQSSSRKGTLKGDEFFCLCYSLFIISLSLSFMLAYSLELIQNTNVYLSYLAIIYLILLFRLNSLKERKFFSVKFVALPKSLVFHRATHFLCIS